MLEKGRLSIEGNLTSDTLQTAVVTSALTAVTLLSLRGRGSADPITTTTDNFIRAAPLAVVLNLLFLAQVHWSLPGLLLGLLSGSITSGLGYVVWYAALRGLTATRAAVVQLAVPVIAASGGVVFMSELISTRLIIASITVLGGVGLAVMARDRGRA